MMKYHEFFAIRAALCTLPAIFCGAAAAGPPELSAPLNYIDATQQRIVQNVGEQPNNEKSVASGDFDRDGDPDIAIAVALSDFTQRRNKLYRNDGGVFVEVSGAPAVPAFAIADVSRTLFFRDFDGDGWDDLYIVNDQNVDNDLFLRNDHPGGIFAGFVDETAGRLPNGGNLGASCTGFAADYDGDGDLDVYAGNYPNTPQDRLIFNDGQGVFSDMTDTKLPDDSDYTVHTAVADMNGDGKLDVILANDGNDPQFIYYNDNLDQGEGPGDFDYPGSVQQIGPASNRELVLIPVDLDNDGDQDLYWSNPQNTSADRLLRNDGNDAANKAQFTPLTGLLPAAVTTRATRKVTVADLNGDGREDLVAMYESSPNSRPVILRNLSHGGEIAFIDWTPGGTFPDGDTHKGWHALAVEINGDGAPDLFLGGFNNDHFFDSAPSPVFTAAELGGVLPPLLNADPVVIDGEFIETGSGVAIPWRLEALVRGPASPLNGGGRPAGNGIATAGGGQTVTLAMNDAPAGALVGLIAASCGDVTLSVRDGGNQLIAQSERGADTVEEFVQFSAPGGPLTVEIAILAPGACGDVIFNDGFEER